MTGASASAARLARAKGGDQPASAPRSGSHAKTPALRGHRSQPGIVGVSAGVTALLFRRISPATGLLVVTIEVLLLVARALG